MMSPAQAMLWQVWRRHRYGLAAGWAYLLICAVAIRWLPQELFQLRLGDSPLPLVAQYLGTPCFFIVLHVAAMFCVAGETTKDFDFPTHRFVLPVATRELVWWPMVQGSVALACTWWLIAALVLRPAGIAAPSFWPAGLLAANLTALQAKSWIPIAQNWVRIVIATPTFMLLNSGVILIAILGVPEPIITGLLLGVLPLNYLVALHGVSMGRRGDVYDWQAWHRLVAWVAAGRRTSQKPFSSPLAAQLWYECRGHAWVLPAFVASMMSFLGFIIAGIDRYNVELGWRLLAITCGLPILMATIVGPQYGNRDVWSKYSMGPFLGTRPISSASLVACKLKMCAISAAITWMIMFAALSVTFLLRTGFWQSVWQVMQSAGLIKATGIVVLVIVLLIFLTWLQLASSLWLGLAGREWVATTAVFGFLGLMALAGGAGFWLYLHPQYYPAARAALPWLLGLMVSLKAGVGIGVLAALLRGGLASASTAAALISGWVIFVAGLCALTMWFSPLPLPIFVLAAVVALPVPLSRLVVAPLALSWNRHR
jgi:hypothetical protein